MLATFSLLLAAVCLVPSAGKILGHPKMRRAATDFGIAWSRYQLIAIPELAAAAGVLTGLVYRPVGVAAGAGMSLLLLGALAFHRKAHDALHEALPALIAIAVTAAYLAVALTA